MEYIYNGYINLFGDSSGMFLFIIFMIFGFLTNGLILIPKKFYTKPNLYYFLSSFIMTIIIFFIYLDFTKRSLKDALPIYKCQKISQVEGININFDLYKLIETKIPKYNFDKLGNQIKTIGITKDKTCKDIGLI